MSITNVDGLLGKARLVLFDIVRKLNAAARQGGYTAALWKEYTGRTLEELDAQWRADLTRRLQPPDKAG